MYDNIRKPLMSNVARILREQGIFDETVTGATDTFTFPLDEPLNYVVAISPVCVAHYLPTWLKEQFAKRGVESFVISKLEWTATANDIPEGDIPKITISGKVTLK